MSRALLSGYAPLLAALFAPRVKSGSHDEILSLYIAHHNPARHMKTLLLACMVGFTVLLSSGYERVPDSSDSPTEAAAPKEFEDPILLAETETYTEAPVLDEQGNIYISEPYRGPITRVTPDGEVSVWAETEGANGHRILEDGSHLVCDRVRRAVLKLDENGQEMAVAASTCGEAALRHPNDIVLDARGGFYFTDPRRGQDDPIGRVCYVDAQGQSHIVAQWEGFPNGITLSPDGDVLYVAEFSRNEILRFPITAPGEVGPESLFAQLPQGEGVSLFGPDGIMFGPEGYLYVAHFGMGTIHVLNAQGELVRSLPAGEKNAWSSNLAFGGPNLRTLYITGNPGPNPQENGVLYKLDLQVR
jgi:gluconolactonase